MHLPLCILLARTSSINMLCNVAHYVVVFIIYGLNIPLNDMDVLKCEHLLQKNLTTYGII